jgi:hypothetical protein
VTVRILVCGGRHYSDRDKVFLQLDWLAARYFGDLFLIEGGAQGADRWAREWRADRLIPGRTFLADWERLGKKAGPLRNARMLKEGRPDLVVAFPGKRGTRNMIEQARAASVPVIRIAAPVEACVDTG